MKVVFLHALPFDERIWEPQLEAFAEHDLHAPRLYDLGSGIDEWALAVLQQVPGRFLAVGASMGGYTAAGIARLAPERLAGLVLSGSRADADAPERRPVRDADELVVPLEAHERVVPVEENRSDHGG
jgi:pimeloyl-ACP methyl ester carboxylesterase